MPFKVRLFGQPFFPNQAPVGQLDDLAKTLHKILHKQELIMIDTSKILAAVAAERTKVDALIALANGLSASMKDLAKQLADAIANNDPAAMAQVQADLDKAAADLDAESAAVQTAIDANTPPAPPT